MTNLKLQGIIFRVESEDELFPVDLPALVSLDIRYPEFFDGDEDDDNYISNLWDCINAPALESLSLSSMDGEQFHAIMASLRRQRLVNATAGLASLCLRYIKIDDHTVDFELACPDISDLTLAGAATKPVLKFILETDLKSLASNTETGFFWPNLHTLSVAWYEDEILRALVLSRKATGHPLVKLRLANCFAGAVDWYRQHVETVQIWHDY